jgi:hypothetical protein
MTNNALIYRPPSKWPVVGAFAAIFHLCAVALASHRASPSTDASPPIVTGEVPAFVDLEPAPALPDPEELPLPLPPPDSSAPEFVEPTPAPSIRRNQRAIHPVRPARPSSAVTFARALTLSAPRPDYPYEARRGNITGSGVVALTVDEATGSVVAAEMEQTIDSKSARQLGSACRLHSPSQAQRFEKCCQLARGASTMADPVLQFRRQLGKCLAETLRDENRIVTKSIPAARRRDNVARDSAGKGGDQFAGLCQSNNAAKSCAREMGGIDQPCCSGGL